MALRKGAWIKKELAIPGWSTPRSWLSRSEVAAMLQVPRSTLQRLARRGDGPPLDATSFSGNAVRYQLVQVLAWWGRITGLLPGSTQGVWEWWVSDESRNLSEHRRSPPERGNRPRGVRNRRWRQVCRVRTRNDLLWAKFALAALDASHPQARSDLMTTAKELKESSSAYRKKSKLLKGCL